MSSPPDLHFYQVSSKYSKGCSSYRADKNLKFYTDANGIRPKNNMPPPPPPPHTHTHTHFWSGGGGGGVRGHNESEEIEEKEKKKQPLPLPAARTAGLAQL